MKRNEYRWSGGNPRKPRPGQGRSRRKPRSSHHTPANTEFFEFADFVYFTEIDLCRDESGLCPRIRQNFSPGVDDQSVAIGHSITGMIAGLRRRHNETSRLNRPRAQQHMPMCLSRHLGEGRRHSDQFGASMGERTIQRRKTKIVTNGKSKLPPGKINDDGFISGSESGAFRIALAVTEIDVEHMNLVVCCNNLAQIIKHISTVCDPAIVKADGQTPAVDPHFVLSRGGAERGESFVIFFWPSFGGDRFASPLHHGDVLGHHDEVCTVLDSLFNKPQRRIDIVLQYVSSSDLKAGNRKLS